MAIDNLRANVIILPGLIKSNASSFEFILREACDKLHFIVVTEEHCSPYLSIFSDIPFIHILSIKPGSSLANEQAKYPPMLYQWFKFNQCLRIILSLEFNSSLRVNRIFKLRTDYFYNNPSSLINEVCSNQQLINDFIYCESDRVFFGSRDTIFSLRHFLDLSFALFVDKPDYYYPLHIPNLLSSDLTCTRWERVNFDRRTMNCPDIHSLRSHTSLYLSELNQSQEFNYSPPSSTDIYSFHTGNRILPAERSFAWYLNVHGIIPKAHSSMSGGVVR